jgi:DNA-binding transcriptional ArsR family regulator
MVKQRQTPHIDVILPNFAEYGHLDETVDSWRSLFNTLLQYKQIPANIVEAVGGFSPHDQVTWIFDNRTAAIFLHQVRPFVGSEKLPRDLTDDDKKIDLPRRADEALAFYLWVELRTLKLREQTKRKGKSSTSPVFGDGLIPRSIIASVAAELVSESRRMNCPVGEMLERLLNELLGSTMVSSVSDEYVARRTAVWTLVQESIGVRKLATRLDVAPSTVSRWLKDSRFLAEVQEVRDHLLRHSKQRDRKKAGTIA